MLVQSGAGLAFVPGALAHINMDGIPFRPFTPERERITVEGTGRRAGLSRNSCAPYTAIMTAV
jgi:hypothetical protein